MTQEEKLKRRDPYIKGAFAFMIIIPLLAMIMLYAGIDVTPITGIFATASATFGAIIVAHFGTSPKE